MSQRHLVFSCRINPICNLIKYHQHFINSNLASMRFYQLHYIRFKYFAKNTTVIVHCIANIVTIILRKLNYKIWTPTVQVFQLIKHIAQMKNNTLLSFKIIVHTMTNNITHKQFSFIRVKRLNAIINKTIVNSSSSQPIFYIHINI